MYLGTEHELWSPVPTGERIESGWFKESLESATKRTNKEKLIIAHR